MSHSSLFSWFSEPWQGKPSFLSHTCLSWLLGSSFMQGSWETGWEEAGEVCGYRVYGYKDQNEKENLSCHRSLGPAVMPSIKLNWDAVQDDPSLFICLSFIWWSFRELSVCICCWWWCWLRIHGWLQPAVDYFVSRQGREGVFKNHLSQVCIFSLSLYHGYVSSWAQQQHMNCSQRKRGNCRVLVACLKASWMLVWLQSF